MEKMTLEQIAIATGLSEEECIAGLRELIALGLVESDDPRVVEGENP